MTPTDTLREAVARAIDDALGEHGDLAVRHAADAALSAIEAAGWRIVPAEPTEAMIEAGVLEGEPVWDEAIMENHQADLAKCTAGIFRAMLSAAPRLDATVRSGEEG